MKFNYITVDTVYKDLNHWKELKSKEKLLNKSLIQNINNKIEFKNVSFAFDGKKNILKDFSFDFNKNQKIGLSGISGSGKTTLTDILTGLIKPSNGKILCDEIDINRDIYGWQNQIAYVPQNVILIDDTIEFAKSIIKNSPIGISSAKSSINNNFNLDRSSGLKIENKAYSMTLGTKDRQEALKAFKEKRKPIWQNK